MKSRKEKNLLPCPFCGTIPIIEPWHGGGPLKRLISCQNENCEVAPAVTGTTQKKAITYWNYRTT